jgi:Ras-related protein Rab-8A
MNVWDCGGHKRFRPIIQPLYDHISGTVIMYDMTDDKSFQELVYWHNEVIRSCPGAAIMVVGTKCDLTDKIKITAEDGQKQCKEWHVPHMVVSSKTGQGIELVFSTILSSIFKKI